MDAVKNLTKMAFQPMEMAGVSSQDIDAFVERNWIRIWVSTIVFKIELFYVWCAIATHHESKSAGLFGLVWIIAMTTIFLAVFEAARLYLSTLAEETLQGGGGGGGGGSGGGSKLD